MSYNERYSKTLPIQRGDMERMYMALGVAGDYLMWLGMRGLLPGSGQGISEQVHYAREAALALYQRYEIDAATEQNHG